MKITKKDTIPAVPERTIDREVGVECDLCGARPTNLNNGACAPFGRTSSNGNVNECTVRLDTGYGYAGEGGNITHTSYDVCPTCWRDVLVPLFKNPPTVREVDF